MKGHKKKDKSSEDAKFESNFANEIDELTEAMTEELDREKCEASDPFEHYVQKVRGKMHSDFELFRSRFVKGYNVLLEEIAHEHEFHDKKHH